ncbi:MAG: hypothetical protein A3G28_01425 [Betaproteobacteria bacterium RIFCSPLOWO2_12_FULL_68_19]|nr:MAG: hypothetical protein A3G28_01425 [Betaproteobacteria bacterium RIFCSPLOWO2_12_FULL_68_19]
MQAADRVAQQRRGAAGGVAVRRHAQGLLEGGFEAVEELVHARLQPLVLADQRVAGHDAHHAGVLLGEREQHLDQPLGLAVPVGLVLGDAVGQREDRALDELNQALVHLRLGSEVAVERGLGDVQLPRQGGGGDALPFRRLEHLREGFQDLELAFPFGARHGK